MPLFPHRTMNTLHRHLKLIVAAVVVIIVGSAFVVLHQMQVLEETRETAAAIIASRDSAFAEVGGLTSGELAALRTYRNAQHVETAQRLGVSDVAGREAVEELVDEEELVCLESNEYYHLQKMDYSVPCVTPSAANLLDRIGQRFQEALAEQGLPPYRYYITSGTRTREDQRALQQVNINAASKSSHEFGTTLDLHYGKYGYVVSNDSLPRRPGLNRDVLVAEVARGSTKLGLQNTDKLKAILGRVLREMQREGDVMVIHERRQPVYHITVADEVAPLPSDEDEPVLTAR